MIHNLFGVANATVYERQSLVAVDEETRLIPCATSRGVAQPG